MVIHELAKQSGISVGTIRYYESIGLMPKPERSANNYRQYTSTAVERLRLISGARGLGIPLDDIADILRARDNKVAPCQRVLNALDHRLVEIDQRIADLLTLRETLDRLRREGAALPLDDVCGEHCVCYLLKTYRDSRRIIIQREEPSND
ncbi:Mercuric resistance operon regulatory protein [Anaerolineae bacterium]|nr:Mercuric resistance operon regulatory protein [Anaerolineae bacterium]